MELKSRTNQPVQGDEIANLKVTGELQAFENITDADGHKRFVEGDFTPETITGFTWTYHKWSLSGTHFMIVLAGSVDNATVVANNTILYNIELPSYINSKIVPTYGATITGVQMPLYDGNGGVQQLYERLVKETNGISLKTGSLTLSADRTFRFAFDLLIDNE